MRGLPGLTLILLTGKIVKSEAEIKSAHPVAFNGENEISDLFGSISLFIRPPPQIILTSLVSLFISSCIGTRQLTPCHTEAAPVKIIYLQSSFKPNFFLASALDKELRLSLS